MCSISNTVIRPLPDRKIQTANRWPSTTHGSISVGKQFVFPKTKYWQSVQNDNINPLLADCITERWESVGKEYFGNLHLPRILLTLHSYGYDDYVKCFEELLPVFVHTDDMIHSLKNQKCYNLHWMGVNSKSYLEIYQETRCNHATAIVEHILILTSLLENALANIYYTEANGKQAPHLLKDLLNTEEIRTVFGPELVVILKILIGIPNSINIRNIVWHGFPKPFEIPKYYEAVLLVMIHSLGCKISTLNYNIKERPLVENLETPMETIENELSIDIPNIKYYEQKVNDIDNDFVKDYKPFWLQLFSYYEAKKYVEFIILILPQIELLLRLHYGQINDVDINAKLDEYYITMDSIFETEIPLNTSDKEHRINKLLDFTVYPCYQGCFHLMYDVFLSPNGCRLRDKVSHGEVRLEVLNNPRLSCLVFHIFLNLLAPLNCQTLSEYESKLHLNCINKRQLFEVKYKLKQFNEDFIGNSIDISHVSFKNPSCKVLIFQRPRKEAELMLLIKKITENIYKTLDNYKESIATRSTLKAQRELHSKRRKTLEKLQNSLPQICTTLSLIWHSVNKLYDLLQTDYKTVLEDEGKCLKTLRFLKHALTISENFVKYSHCDSNEWIKSLELCRKFEEFHSKLFLY